MGSRAGFISGDENRFVNAAGINLASTDFWREPDESLQEAQKLIFFWKWIERRTGERIQ